MEFLILVIVIFVATALFGLWLFASNRNPAKPRQRYHLTPSSKGEWLILYSPMLVAFAALLIFAVSSLDHLAQDSLQAILERACALPLPSFWCAIPRPVPWPVTVHAAAYGTFLVASVLLIARIATGRIPKPARYREGSLPIPHQIFLACFWLFVIAGGQFLVPPKLFYVSIYAGLAMSLGYLCFALCAIRALAIAVKYRTHSGL